MIPKRSTITTENFQSDCDEFFHISAYCNINPNCVGRGGTQRSHDCPEKNFNNRDNAKTQENVETLQPICYNYEDQHPSNCKGCKMYPLKP